MERTERFYKLVRLLEATRPPSKEILISQLEVSEATLKRDVEYLRDRFQAPIVYDRAKNGYRFDIPPGKPRFQLPGIWFSSREAHALLVAHQLLSNLEPGLLSGFVEPLKVRIRALLDGTDHSFDEVEKRIRILALATRALETRHFEIASSGVLLRRRLHIQYRDRTSGHITERDISPQRMVHYRDNWYVDAWCHLRNALRTFSLDCVLAATILDARAKNVSERDLDQHLGSGYGIFSGSETLTAVLKFNPIAARWIANEQWHPMQKSRREPDGSYVLEIPYANDGELLMDIMRYGAKVEVLAPEGLRRKVKEQHDAAARLYDPTPVTDRNDPKLGGDA